MPLSPPRSIEEFTDIRWLARWCQSVTVTPSAGSVTAPALSDEAVTARVLGPQSVTTPKLADNAVDNSKLRDSTPYSVIGKSGSSTGDPENIAASADGQFLRRRAGTLGFGSLLRADVTGLEESGDFTATLTGCTTTPTGTVYWNRVGNVVVLRLPQINATSDTTAATLTGAPAGLFPARTHRVLAPVQDNSAVVIGTAQVETTGVITLGLLSGAFTASGTKGIEALTLTYPLT